VSESGPSAWLGPVRSARSHFRSRRRYAKPTRMVLQYTMIDEEQSRGTQLQFQFWKPGEISPPVSMTAQDAVYERLRLAAAQHGVVLDRVNHP
jgi:hypothetical protein